MAMLNNQRVVWNSNLPLTQNFLRWFSKSSHNRNNDQTMHDRNIILPKLSLADLYIHLYIYKYIPVFPWIVSEPPVTLDYTHQFISRYHMYLQSQQYIYIYIHYIYKYKSKYEYKYIYEAIYIYRYIYYTVSHGSIPGAISPQVLRLLQVLCLLHLSHDLEALVLVDRGIYIYTYWYDMIWKTNDIYLYIYIYCWCMIYDIFFDVTYVTMIYIYIDR